MSNINPKEKHPTTKQTEEFVRLFSQDSHRLRAYIYALLLDSHDADEVFQNTSCRLWQKFDTFDVSTSFMPWACRVAYLEVCNFRRVKGRRPILSDEVVKLIADHVDNSWEEIDPMRDSLNECLQKLPQSDRELLQLRFYEQARVKDIAARLKISIYSVYRRLTRVYSQLLICIQSGNLHEGAQR